MKIATNNKPRPLVYGWELTEKEREEFDYMEDIDSEQFISYQGMILALSDFMRLPDDSYEAKHGWNGVYEMNTFCGILVKIDKDMELAIVGKVLC